MIAETIQLAVAPVFLLVAIASILNLLAARLGRIVDRSRHLQGIHTETTGVAHDKVVAELRTVAHRIDLINRAMFLLVLSGLVVGLTVVLLFIGEAGGVSLAQAAAAAFIVSIGLLMFALVLFLAEARAASNSLRIPDTFLERDRKL
ncbi:MAG: DUF2721 domain-containing protein [Parerythrobacter sp.]